MKKFYYEELRFDNNLIKDWYFVDSEDFFCRLHYKPKEFENGKFDVGFDFYATAWVSNRGDYEAYETGSETTVECIFRGYAAFDGIRHLYWGDPETENEGYDYYPNLGELQWLLSELQKLEDKYCPNR